MATTEEILKACQNLEELVKEQIGLGKDAIAFIAEKGLWKEFLIWLSQRGKK